MTQGEVSATGAAATSGRVPALAWAIWGLGLLAYVVAVFHRSSLGVSGLLAQHRFGVGAATLSLFSVLQLGVYAAMQVPVGVLLDRFGSRRLLVTGGVVMAAGQAALALAHGVATAVLARVLVGTGDAMTFISVLRLVAFWFPPRHVPVVQQLTGILGQLGQVAATYPLVILLHHLGWTPSFLVAAAIGGVVAVTVAVALRDAPRSAGVTAAGRPLGEVRYDLAAAWQEAGTRLGLWTHFTTQFSSNVFGLLWGFPFLVSGEGLDPGTAGALLTVMVLVGMVIGPTLGRLVGRWPLRRSVLVLAIVATTAAMWTVVLAWPGRAPLPVLVCLVVVLASGGPGSMIGFDYARTANPAARMGSASGIVNVGGFVASLSTILAIGVLLDLVSPGGSSSYSLGAFRLAFAAQYVGWAVGLGGVVRNRRILRRRLAESGRALDSFPTAVVRRWRSRPPRVNR